LENLLGYQIVATNGTMGTVADFFFLDDSKTVRYIVVSAGGWLNRRKVLLSTESVDEIDDQKREVRVNLTREQVYISPDIETDKPVTRQMEILLAKHYGWKHYWTVDPFFGVHLPPQRIDVGGSSGEPGPVPDLEGCDPHLRSFREVTNYVMRSHRPLGYVTDMIANDIIWHLHGFVVADSPQSAGSLLVPANWVVEIDWSNCIVRMAPDPNGSDEIPAFHPSAPVNPRFLIKYFDYHGRLHHTALAPELERKS
jgi:hypothetical protein